ncbi:hypothetical protein [Pseudomonas moraviensis]
MNSEVIAKLVGVLQFQVDISGLQRFERGLSQARQKMMALSREADVLSKKLGTKMGIKVDSAGQEKLAKTVRANLDRELKLEQAVQRTRRATFTAELQGQKLVNLRQKEGAAIQSHALRDKISLAVLDAKSAKAEGERLKVSGAALKQAQSIEQHKARQARWEALLTQQQQKTAILRQKEFQAMTATQRVKFALQQARIRGHRTAEKFAASQEAAKLRAQRLDVSHAQKAERFQWAQTRQAHWEAKRNEPKPSTSFMGIGTGALALGGVTAGLAAIVGAVSALGDRLSATQTRVSESQQFSNILEQAAGKNPANKDFAKSEFLRISETYGTAVDNDSAKDYRTYLLAQMARGKSLSAATADFETTMAAYRGAGLTRDEQRRTSLQYQQVRSKTVADREDLNTFSEAAPLLVEPIRRAWAERNKHPLDANLEKDFRASTKTGNLKAIDFENGIKLFVKENAAAIERQNGSIDANSTRLANQQFLQQQGLDQNPELINSINERIKSEMELTEALKPLKEAAVQADIALNKMAASFARFIFGKDDTPEQAAKKIDGLSPDQPAIDVSALSTPKPSTGEKPKDPISRLFRMITGSPDYDEGPANRVKSVEPNTLGMQFPKLDLTKLRVDMDMGQLAERIGEYQRFRADTFEPITSRDLMRTSGSSVEYPVQQITTTNEHVTNNNSTIAPTINVTVNTVGGDEALGKVIGDEFDARMQKMLRETQANQKELY